MKRYLVFLCGLMFLLGIQTPASPIELPKTGQTFCYDEGGNVIDCTGTGQDGAYQKGIPWPVPRFTDNGDGTVTDNLTKLIWLKNANRFGAKTWLQALNDCNTLADDGIDLTDGSVAGDWRLPIVNELESLIHAEEPSSAAWLNSQGFTNVQGLQYWSSTTYAVDPPDPSNAWTVNMWNGELRAPPKVNLYSVWPVRAATAPPAELPRTGQTVSYAAGDDGDIQAGVAWPSPRFTVNPDATVTDELTGLVWAPDGNIMPVRDPGWDQDDIVDDGMVTWQHALDYVAKLNAENYLGLNDWRLPNVNELESLIHAGEPSSATWLNLQGFANVQQDWYWSSTSYAFNPSRAWYIGMFGMFDGYVLAATKTFSYYVWPVREISEEGATPPLLLPRSSGGGGCFIATAAYGSGMAEEVKVLKEVRDEYLLTNSLGKALVSFYYKQGPKLAGFISNRPLLKSIVRVGLYPLVRLSGLVMDTEEDTR